MEIVIGETKFKIKKRLEAIDKELKKSKEEI